MAASNSLNSVKTTEDDKKFREAILKECKTMFQDYIKEFLVNIKEMFKSVINEINNGRNVESACENLIERANHKFMNKTDSVNLDEVDLRKFAPPTRRTSYISISDDESGVLSTDVEQRNLTLNRKTKKVQAEKLSLIHI